MRGELEALELALAALEQADRTAEARTRVACPVARAAARSLSALPPPSEPAGAFYRAVELAALSLLADDPDPARGCPPPDGGGDWLDDVVAASARRLLAVAAREDGARAKAEHERLLREQPLREAAWLGKVGPSLQARRRAFSLFAAYRLSDAVVRLSAGERDPAAALSEQARCAADRGIDIRLSVACTWVGSVARAAIRPCPPVAPIPS